MVDVLYVATLFWWSSSPIHVEDKGVFCRSSLSSCDVVVQVCFGEVVIGNGCTLEAYAAVSAGTILAPGTVVKGIAPEQAAVGTSKAAAPLAVEAVPVGDVSGDVSTTQTKLSEVRLL